MRKWPWFGLSLFILFLDQITKYWVKITLMPYETIPWFPGLNITLAYNTGAAFSFLNQAGVWHILFFIGFGIIMSLVLTYWILHAKNEQRLQLAGFALILGGALGNLLDRILFGHVIDFVQLYYKIYSWPVFNLADSAICIGAGLLILDLSMNKEKKS